MKNLILILLPLFSLVSLRAQPVPSDPKATAETINLFQNMLKLQQEGMMFGHEDALAYGIGWVYEEGRSDVKDVVGDYPAVYGWELGHLELGNPFSLDSVHFDKIRDWIILVYERGGVNTISWHLRNPLTGGTAWDTSSDEVVKSILPGGRKHELFKQYLNRLAEFFKQLKTDDGTYVPVLFRPFHEHTGSWFWWGENLCTEEEYEALWHFTVDYLQQEKDIHHVLYAYSTDRFETLDEYLERYPGDEIVDMLGFDLYDRGPGYRKTLLNCAELVSGLAQEKEKIAAVTETGGPISNNTQWWTQLLETLKPFDLSYVLVWRNPWEEADHGAFAPYKGSPDATNFVEFYNDPETLFQEEITKKNLYE